MHTDKNNHEDGGKENEVAKCAAWRRHTDKNNHEDGGKENEVAKCAAWRRHTEELKTTEGQQESFHGLFSNSKGFSNLCGSS